MTELAELMELTSGSPDEWAFVSQGSNVEIDDK
jgi:hypothetical protein